MITYDESTVTYDEPSYLYDGVLLGTVALVVAGVDHTAEVADRSLSAHVGTHGNSRGTLDAILNDPSTVPAVDDIVALYIDYVQRFRGTLKASETTEYRGGFLFQKISAEDEGPLTALPSAAPFGLSDAPNETTTFGYVSLEKRTRTTEGGTAKTTYLAVVKIDGLWANQLLEITSANFGLSATELEVNEITVSWENQDTPRYALILGDPIVRLQDLILDGDVVPDGTITTTKIADDSISTPKLKANVVTTEKIASDAEIAFVTNTGGDVVVDGSGLTVTEGAMTLTNAGAVVVIDGTSNMFKIAATGTQSVTASAGASANTSTSLSGLGALATTPAHLSFVSDGNSTSAHQRGFFWHNPMYIYVAGSSGGSPTQKALAADWQIIETVRLDASSYATPFLFVDNNSGSSKTAYSRYYVLQEAAL